MVGILLRKEAESVVGFHLEQVVELVEAELEVDKVDGDQHCWRPD